jgi:hypothetical protein
MKPIVIIAIAFALLIPMGVNDVFAQSYTGSLTLNPISSQVSTGDTVTFSGKFVTTSGQAIPGATIYIKDNVSFGSDKTIRTALTDNSGNFRVSWSAVERSSGSYDFYAIFEGSSNVSKSKSSTYTVSVSSSYSSSSSSGSTIPTSYTGILTLNPISSQVSTGDTVTFSGKFVTTSGQAIPGATIYIKDSVRLGSDKTIRTALTDNSGNFRVSWSAVERSSGSYDFYAIFEGSSNVSKSRSSTFSVLVSSPYSSSSSSSSSPSSPTPTISSSYIVLDRIPSSINAGETITFTGKLTSNGQGISNAFVQIMENDPFKSDQRLSYARTNSNGYFSSTWSVTSGLVETDFDIYAVFDGDSSYKRARSPDQTMSIQSNYPTEITLDRIPSSIHAGQTITFTGKLTSNGQPVNGLVKIMEDDPASSDQRIGIERTDSNGRFSIVWTVSAGLVETDFDIYAVFDGDSLHKRARSYNQEMSVLKYGGAITLNSFPTSAEIGETITFSGNLDLNQGSPMGAVVYIKDEDTLNPDDLLATAYVDSFGKFSANWFVNKVDADEVADIYAVFEGNDIFYRLTTCDTNPTLTFGSSCQNTFPLRTTSSFAPPPPTPPTSTGTTDPTLSGNEYMELYYSLDLNRNPRVAIIPSPDSYDEAKRHIAPIQEGIKMWESELDRKFGGTWNVNFEIIQPGELFFNDRPDIVMNIVTADEDINCLSEYSGWAIIWKSPPKPVQTQVCTTSSDIGATAAHEFIHAMGLGHAFNKKGDLMCSAELVGGQWVPTCPSSFSRSSQPSDFNLAATGFLYNLDGFKNPNNRVSYESKFTVSDYLGGNTNPIIPIPEPTTPTDSDGDGVVDDYDSCPFEWGSSSNNGCPIIEPTPQPTDSDGDGVVDDYDSCPFEWGSSSNNGCPINEPIPQQPIRINSDGDMFADEIDNCPYQYGYRYNDGCPFVSTSQLTPVDRDGDGVMDDPDACPNTYGVISNDGCAPPSVHMLPLDSDGDGADDVYDNCPYLWGSSNNNYCPPDLPYSHFELIGEINLYINNWGNVESYLVDDNKMEFIGNVFNEYTNSVLSGVTITITDLGHNPIETLETTSDAEGNFFIRTDPRDWASERTQDGLMVLAIAKNNAKISSSSPVFISSEIMYNEETSGVKPKEKSAEEKLEEKKIQEGWYDDKPKEKSAEEKLEEKKIQEGWYDDKPKEQFCFLFWCW